MKNSRNKILASAIKPKSANKKGDLKLVKKAVKDLSKVVPFSMSRQVDSLKRVCLEKISIFSDELSNNPKKLDSFNPYPSQGIIPPEKEDNKTAERRNSVRKNLFSYGVYGINLSSRLFKLIAVFLIVGVNLHGLSAVGITVAHFADSEKSSGNLIDSAILDFSLSTAGWAPSDPLYPGSSTTENIIVADEDDSVDFKYIASIVETGGDHNFCEEIGLEASLDGAPVYSGDLLSFVSSNINFGSTTDEWSFKVKLPSDASDVDGKKCEFDFLYQSWQNEFPVYPNGFHDEEKVQNKIESAKKTCNSDDDNDNHGRDDDDDEHHGSDGHHNGGDYDDSDSNEHHNEHDNFNNQHYSDDRGHDDDDEDDDDNCSSPKEDEKLIVINEFLPNPIGNDNKHMPKGEWVELYNLGDNPINVADWVLYDNNDSHPLKIKLSNSDNDGNLGDGGETIVPPHGFLVVYLNGKYNGWLNNTGGDSVRLYSGEIGSAPLIDSYSYDCPAPENKSYARIPDGTGGFVDPIPTPLAPNKITDALEIDTEETDEGGSNSSSSEGNNSVSSFSNGGGLVPADIQITSEASPNSSESEIYDTAASSSPLSSEDASSSSYSNENNLNLSSSSSSLYIVENDNLSASSSSSLSAESSSSSSSEASSSSSEQSSASSTLIINEGEAAAETAASSSSSTSNQSSSSEGGSAADGQSSSSEQSSSEAVVENKAIVRENSDSSPQIISADPPITE